MEIVPNFENGEDPDRLVMECQECGDLQFLDDENTVVFLPEPSGDTPEPHFNSYVKCHNDCEPTIYEIAPDHIQYYGYLTNWYNHEGKIPEIQLKGILLGVVEVEGSTWDEKLLAEIQYAEPWEYANDHEQKRWSNT